MTDQFSTTPSDIPGPLSKKSESIDVGEKHVLQVIQEQIDIQKVVVETGVVRVRKIVHEQTDTVDIPLISDEVIVTRLPIDKIVSDVFPSRQEGDTLIIPVFTEIFIKQIILVEEVHMTTRRSLNNTTQQVPLKREEVIVDRYDPESGIWNPDISQ